jgi:polar amino acid transport system substrate-binding protein
MSRRSSELLRRSARTWLLAVVCASSPLLTWACGPHPVGASPYGRLLYQEGSGPLAGIDVDLIGALAHRSGCALPLTMSSRAAVSKGFEQGTVSLSPSNIATEERAKWGELWPYARSPMVVLVPETLSGSLADRDAFMANAHLNVVTVRGHRHGPDLDAWVEVLRKQGRVTEAGDVPSALRVIRAGRAHALIIVAVAVDPTMNDMAPMPWDRDSGVVGHLWVAHHVPAADRQRLRVALSGILADGTVDRIFRKHLGPRLAARARLEPAAPAP